MTKAKTNGNTEGKSPGSWEEIQAQYSLVEVLNALAAHESRKRYNASDKAQARRKEYNRKKAVLLRKAIEMGIVVTDEELQA